MDALDDQTILKSKVWNTIFKLLLKKTTLDFQPRAVDAIGSVSMEIALQVFWVQSVLLQYYYSF